MNSYIQQESKETSDEALISSQIHNNVAEMLSRRRSKASKRWLKTFIHRNTVKVYQKFFRTKGNNENCSDPE